MQLSRQISHVAGPTDAEKKAAKGALFGAMGIAGGVL
jgi:hypothetical protein